MIKATCIHLGVVLDRATHLRRCNHPDRRGTCRKLKDCQVCELHVPIPVENRAPRVEIKQDGPIQEVLKRALKVLEPCVHSGNVLEYCQTCKGEAKHVRECDVHGKCTFEFVSEKVMNCRRCQMTNLGFERDPNPPG